MQPHRFVLIAGIVCGLAFVVITPPFQVPDEPSHFYRAYAVSEGHLRARHGQGQAGDVLPASLQEIGTRLRGDLPGNPHLKIAPGSISAAFEVPLDANRKVFTDFRTSAQFTALPYLPQAAGIAVVRAFGAAPLVLLYAARISNLLVTTALMALAVAQFPAYRWLMASLALTPMALFIRSSASADATTIAIAFLLSALAARFAWGDDERLQWRDVAVLIGLSGAICLTKPVYAPLVLLILLIPGARFPSGRRAAALAVHAIVVTAALLAGFGTAAGMHLPMRSDVAIDRDAQVAAALAEPLRAVTTIAHDYLLRGDRYAAQMVGQLGWLDVNLPKPLLIGHLLMLSGLLLVEVGERVHVSWRQRFLLVLITTTTLALVSAAVYATWNAVRAGTVEGIQGRYFIPLAPAAVWMFHSRRFRSAAPLGRIVPWLSLASLGVAFVCVWNRYYG